jgi:hypothetical protein
MPHRILSLAILAAWAWAAVALFRRDVLPDLLVGPPPDLRSVARAEGEPDRPSRWIIQVVDDGKEQQPRPVGQVDTIYHRARDGWYRMESLAWFDSAELLAGTPLAAAGRERIEIRSVLEVDPSGNLDALRAAVHLDDQGRDLVVITGAVKGNELEVNIQGAVPLLAGTRRFPYQPRELVQNDLGPLDRMPGLQVGQRWVTRMVSPLTGRVERVEVSVERRRLITWDAAPVSTLEVVTRTPLISARTWVRPDGLVLRQELPFPLVRLVLERLPDRYIGPDVMLRPATRKDRP